VQEMVGVEFYTNTVQNVGDLVFDLHDELLAILFGDWGSGIGDLLFPFLRR
jgi:hypothetical protein